MYTYVSNPYCKVKFATEKGNLEIFQMAKGSTSDNLDFDILSIDTTRDVGADDCATFSISLAYRDEWYEKIHSCDLVIIEMGRGKDKGTVIYGIVDNVYKSMAYVDLVPKRVISISGRGFNKALIQFDIGAVQEIGGMLSGMGFFKGQDMLVGQNSPSRLIEITLEHYLNEGVNLNFANGKSFKDYFNAIYLDNQRQKEESYGNTFNAYEFQGSLWSYLKELRNAPFNELYWEIVDEKPTLISRPTPFNPRDWANLQLFRLDEKDIIDENLGRSDLETYTVYSVKGESLINEFDQMFGTPVWYKPYYDRYGLRRLQVTSKYKPSDYMGPTGESDGGGNFSVSKHNKSEYERDLELQALKFDKQTLEKTKSEYEGLSDNRARQQTGYMGGSSDELKYKVNKEKEKAVDNVKADIEEAKSLDTNAVSQKTIDLFNWNIKNAQMENGTIVLRGDAKYKVGCRAYIVSSDMEYYIENVSHNFVYSEGWKTTLQVTRGLEYGTRFNKPWNQYELITIEDIRDISGIDYSTMNMQMTYGDMGNFVPMVYSDPTGFRSRVGAIARSHAGEEYNMNSQRMDEGKSDCSSFVYKVTMEAQGRNWRGTWAPATYTMIPDGERLKLWYQIPLSQAQPWDILLRDGHTEFLSDDGRTYGAHTWNVPSGPGARYDPNRWTTALRIYGL